MKKGTIEGAVPLVAWAVPDARNGTARIIVAAMRTAAARGTRSLILGSAAYDPCSFGKSHFAVSGSATTARTAGLISRQRPPREARRPHPARAPDGRPGEGRVTGGRPLRSSRTRCARSRATLTPRGRHFVEQRETFADEGGQVLRLTRRHQVASDDDLLIDDVRTDELEVALDRPPGRQPMVLVRAGGEEELRPVADREDRLLPLEERLDERDRRVVRAKAIRREAAPDEQGVELVGPHVRERALDDRGLAALVAVQLLAGFETDDRHLVAGLPECVVGLAEFGVLEAVGKHTRDLHSCSPLLRPAAVVRPTAVPVRPRQCAARAGP